MPHRDVELLAVGAGPSNLALAVALEELAPDDLAAGALVIERERGIAWQRGLLLTDAVSQVSFLKDLVTLRNPRSAFSFVNYLHSVGRLDDFINIGSFLPYRAELSSYFQWVADTLTRVRVEYGRECTDLSPVISRAGEVTGWRAGLADGSTIDCRYLVVGAGRDANVPAVFAALPCERVVHSTRYVDGVAGLRTDPPLRVAVVGGAQSAAEMFLAVLQDLPGCRPTMIMRSIGLNTYETSKFTNELYFPSFVDEFYAARPAARAQLLAEMHRSNYAGLAPATLESLYRQFYLDRLNGSDRLRMITMVDVTSAGVEGDDVVLTVTDRKTGSEQEVRVDVVLLGTGFVPEMPQMIRRLADALGLDGVEVTRQYRMELNRPATAACYLQGVNQATHGIADSLLSVLAIRAHEIAGDIFEHRAAQRSAEHADRAQPPQTAGIAASS